MRRLAGSRAAVVVLCAPAGFGKTAVLSRWARADERAVAWLTIGPEHRDAGQLADDLLGLVAALGPRADGCQDGASAAPLGRLRRAIARVDPPSLIVIDDAHRLEGGEGLDAVAMLCEGLPEGSQVALGCRRPPALRWGLMDARGMVLRLGPDELAPGGGAAWPAMRRLAASGRPDAVEDFLEEEVLADLEGDERELMVRTSLLERLTPRECDAVLPGGGSGRLLDGLARRGLIVAGDDPREGYRHRPPVAEALAARLARRDPALLGELVRRALPGHLATGRLAVVGGWLAARTPGELGAVPGLALAAAWCGLEGGGEVEHWIAAAGPGPAAALAAAAAGDCSGATAPDHGPWEAAACAVGGIGRDLGGDRDGAVEGLREAARRAGPELPWIEMLSRSWLGLVAVREGAWGRAERLGEQAEAALATPGLDGYASASLAHALAAVLLARSGRADDARRRRAAARGLLDLQRDVAPWRLVGARVLLARASVLMGDPAGAGALLDGAREPLASLPEAAGLRADVASARAAAEGLASGAADRHVPLTAAEVRVLRFLPTHHSFRDIGVQLQLSRFTVKSQALAVYRKLHVTSRGEAVARARAVGLLEDAPA